MGRRQRLHLTDVFSEIAAELIILAPDHSELAAEYLEGWWLNRISQHLMGLEDKGIPVQHVILKAHEIGKSLSEGALPIDDPNELKVKKYSDDDESRLFVRQMRAIQLTDGMVRNATSDFYRAYAQRSRWSRENLILEDELSGYDSKLEDSWRRRFESELLMENAASSMEKVMLGRRVFLWATQESTPLRNVVEKWITAGSYHGLADQKKVRWHPEFGDPVEPSQEQEDE
ncbi:ABC-three component system protein [Leisingera sp. XS_AS12]|uniref:ABC-three component system protein n=1 Tax=Leisingera sp. XS_AS12 TaxID=3241294 RepID=UPI003518A631